MTPTTTAIAKSWITVTPVTRMITNASSLGILNRSFKEGQAKVPITTIIMIPVRAAMGILSISADKNTINTNSAIAAEKPDNRPLPPESIFIIVWPIIAHPPIALKNPQTKFASPCPTHSRLGLPSVSVISSTKVNVSRLSINPMPAMVREKGNTMKKVEKDGDRDYWMKADEAKQYGMVDEVLANIRN